MSVTLRKYSRSIHLWLSLVIFIPVIIVIASGLLLQVKKEFDWLQPPTQKAQNSAPTLAFDDVLATVNRRTDTIEAIHDGSWFFEGAKLWVFLPAAILLFVLWVTGLVMLITTLKSKYRKQKYQQKKRQRR